MFGCHNCKNLPVPGTPYEQTACASCRARHDVIIGSIDHDTENLIPDYHAFPGELFPDELENQDVEKEMLSVLGRALLKLVRMQTRNPATFRVVEAKIDDPYASYSQLAEKLCCRKQNIFYHLRRAAEMCPELVTALQMDRDRHP